MFKTLIHSIFLVVLLASFLTQVKASVISIPCSEQTEVTEANLKVLASDHIGEQDDDCCSDSCCLAGCPCSGNLCSATVYLVLNQHNDHKRLPSELIESQLKQQPQTTINHLYRPPIYTS